MERKIVEIHIIIPSEVWKREREHYRAGDRKYLSLSSFNHDAAARGYPNNWFSVMKTTDAKRIICDGT